VPGILILNHATASATCRCLSALLSGVPSGARVFVLDNGSPGDDARQLADFASGHPDKIRFSASLKNLGFAGGMNLLIGLALADPAVDPVLLLNSDTVPQAGFIVAMQAMLDPATHTDMVAARMLRADGVVDSLGITLYRSTLASNRKREDEILLGPSGGCALLTRRLLEDLHATHGAWFDENFFCYAEDTDLVLRARWLGYRAAYASDAIVHHEGSLSSGGRENDFVLYHGIRNSLWWLVKDAPTGWMLRSLPRFFALHRAQALAPRSCPHAVETVPRRDPRHPRDAAQACSHPPIVARARQRIRPVDRAAFLRTRLCAARVARIMARQISVARRPTPRANPARLRRRPKGGSSHRLSPSACGSPAARRRAS
jgi:GT2 family glycosyltransferase